MTELQSKLDTLRSSLCKRCRTINVDDPRTRYHLQQCRNARRSISHTEEAADIIRTEIFKEQDPLPLSPTVSPSKKRRKRSTTTPPRNMSSQIGQVKRSKSSIPEAVVEESVVRPRKGSIDIVSKFRNPFKKKVKGMGSFGEIESTTPVTTGSGVLIPKLSIRTSSDMVSNQMVMEKQPVSLSPPSQSSRASTLRPKVRSHDSDEMDIMEKDIPDDEDYDADDPDEDDSPHLSATLTLTGSPNSNQESPSSQRGKNLYSAATQVLTIRQRLLDMVRNHFSNWSFGSILTFLL